jgi:hypothetical protein
VQYGWMYPIERKLCTLKRYVRNRARPEGSIAEAYIADECLTFCSKYMDDVKQGSIRNQETWDFQMKMPIMWTFLDMVLILLPRLNMYMMMAMIKWCGTF